LAKESYYGFGGDATTTQAERWQFDQLDPMKSEGTANTDPPVIIVHRVFHFKKSVPSLAIFLHFLFHCYGVGDTLKDFV
jgi:hypothetical protein